MPFVVGDTALLLPVLDAEPLVSAWRQRWDPSAPAGVPAHLTICYPFGPVRELGPQDHTALCELAGSVGALEVAFRRTARFPGNVHLVPEPDAAIRRLVHDVWRRWPQWPPYGGAFAEPEPHVTVTVGAPDDVLAEVEADLAGRLPLVTVLDQLWLIAYDEGRWETVLRFDLAGPSTQG